MRPSRILVVTSIAFALWAGDECGAADSSLSPRRASLSSTNRLPRLPGPPQLRAAYWGALSLVGADDWASARSSVVEMERTLDRAQPVEGLVVLARSEMEVAQRLADVRRDCLPPIAMLHVNAFDSYRREAEPALVSHSSRMAAEVAELYASLVGTEEARGFATSALVCMAEPLGSSGDVRQARVLLDRALRLEPSSEIVLLQLGAIDEKEGRYADAVGKLARLVKAHPDGAEGRLRLAVNLRRVGKAAEAREHLAVCARIGQPDWIRSVAYDELARQALDAERWREAAAYLEEAVRALPTRQSAFIQLSYVYDRLGTPLRARTQAAHLPDRVEPGTLPPSERLRYTAWPRPAAAITREELQETTRAWLGALTAAIATTSSTTEQAQ